MGMTLIFNNAMIICKPLVRKVSRGHDQASAAFWKGLSQGSATTGPHRRGPTVVEGLHQGIGTTGHHRRCPTVEEDLVPGATNANLDRHRGQASILGPLQAGHHILHRRGTFLQSHLRQFHRRNLLEGPRGGDPIRHALYLLLLIGQRRRKIFILRMFLPGHAEDLLSQVCPLLRHFSTSSLCPIRALVAHILRGQFFHDRHLRHRTGSLQEVRWQDCRTI